MSYTVQEQLLMLLYSLILGMGMAIVYDIFCFYTMRIKRLYRYLLEILLWIALTWIAARYMLKNSGGYLTIYTFGLYLIGLMIYFFFMMPSFQKQFRAINHIGYQIYKKVRKTIIIIILPREVLRYLTNKLKRLFQKIFKKRDKKLEESNEIISEA